MPLLEAALPFPASSPCCHSAPQSYCPGAGHAGSWGGSRHGARGPARALASPGSEKAAQLAKTWRVLGPTSDLLCQKLGGRGWPHPLGARNCVGHVTSDFQGPRQQSPAAQTKDGDSERRSVAVSAPPEAGGQRAGVRGQGR